MGKQAGAAGRSMIAQFCIGVPLAYYFGIILGFGNPGLFMGITLGNVLTVTLYTIYILQQDWHAISKEVK